MTFMNIIADYYNQRFSNIRYNLHILDLSKLYIYKPSLYMYNDLSILNLLGHTDSDSTDILDSYIINSIITELLLYPEITTDIIKSYIENLVYDINDEYRIVLNYNISDYILTILVNYIKLIIHDVKSIIKTNIGNSNLLNMSEHITINSGIVMSHVDIIFNKNKYSMLMILKTYGS